MTLNLQRRTSGQAIVMLLILLAILGGGYWWLAHSKQTSEREAREFAKMAATRLACEFDQRFLDKYLGSEAQVRFPPSFRGRMMNWLRELGVASREIEIAGTVTYTSQFFQPVGQFRAHLKYPARYADLDLGVSCPNGWWQVDNVNLSYEPLPTPTPAPVAATIATPAPAVASSPKPRPR